MERQRRGHRVLAGLLGPALILLLASSLSAQVAGRISGYVRDPSGASIVGASVAAVSIERELSRSATIDDTGYYNLLAESGLFGFLTDIPVVAGVALHRSAGFGVAHRTRGTDLVRGRTR